MIVSKLLKIWTSLCTDCKFRVFACVLRVIKNRVNLKSWTKTAQRWEEGLGDDFVVFVLLRGGKDFKQEIRFICLTEAADSKSRCSVLFLYPHEYKAGPDTKKCVTMCKQRVFFCIF